MSTLLKKIGFSVVVMIFISFTNCRTAETVIRSSSIPASIPLGDYSYILINREGQIMQIYGPPMRDFTTLGLVFVESSATFDSNENMIDGSIFLYDMLMKEAHKLGADDIINLKVDEIQNISIIEEIKTVPTRVQRGDAWVTVERETKVQTQTRIVHYKASALAIKYTEAILVPVINSTQNVSNTGGNLIDIIRSR